MLWLPNYLLRGYHREKPRADFRNNSTSTLFTWTFQFLNKTLHEPEIEPSVRCGAGRILPLQKPNKYLNSCFSRSDFIETLKARLGVEVVGWDVVWWLATALLLL